MRIKNNNNDINKIIKLSLKLKLMQLKSNWKLEM
jgi:hypothetical protein